MTDPIEELKERVRKLEGLYDLLASVVLAAAGLQPMEPVKAEKPTFRVVK